MAMALPFAHIDMDVDIDSIEN